MQTIVFQAEVKNGIIKIPEKYWTQLGEVVEVILVADADVSSSTMIDQLLENPIQIEDFVPLSKDEIHDCRQ